MVLFATPMHDGRAEQTYIHSLCGAFKLLEKAGIECDYVSLAGDCFIDRARNRMVDAFLKSDADTLFFIDSDLSFNPQDVLNVLNHDRDIVGGVYSKKTEPLEWCCTIPDGEGLQRTEELPGGFLAIKREVFEAIDVPSYDYNGTQLKEYFKYGTDTGKFVGEDVYFSRLATENGFDLWLDKSIKFGHIGKKTYWS